MKQILWSILAVFVAIVVGGLVVFLVELPAMLVHPWPQALDMNDKAALATHMAKAPPLAMAIVALAWALGPLVASFVACLIVRRNHWVHGLIIGMIFALFDASNFGLFPHPLWLMIAGIVFPLVTASAGAAVARRTFPPSADGPRPYDMRKKNMAC